MKKASLMALIFTAISMTSIGASGAHIAPCDKVDIAALKSDLLEIVETTKFGAELPLYNTKLDAAEKACCNAIMSFQTDSGSDDKMFNDDQAAIHGLLGNILQKPTPAIYVKSVLAQAQKTGGGFPFLSECEASVSHIKSTLNRIVHDKGESATLADLNALTPDEQRCAKSFVVKTQEGARPPKDEQDIARLVGKIDSNYEPPEIHRFYGKSR